LIFVNNLRLDLDPGVRDYIVWMNVILVNVTKLPDSLAAPIAEYVTFRAGAEERNVWNQDTLGRARDAAFGKDGQAFKSWNLLRLIFHAMKTRDVTPLRVVETMANRELGTSDTLDVVPDAPPATDKPRREQPASGVPGAPTTTGPRFQSLARSSSGLQIQQVGPGVADVTPRSDVPAEPPLVAPITMDKLERIRELGELVRDGSIDRVRSIVRKGGPLGRLARELLR
jgi:hypothetical protein